MSRNDTWMPLYVGDYIADTMDLSGAEHGAYLLLLMHYWRNGPLPDDDRKLSKISRFEYKDWKEIAPTVRAFFTVNGNGTLHQKRMDKERERWNDISEKRREAGKAGANAKHNPGKPPNKPGGKPLANATANAEQMPEICHDSASVPLPKQKELDSSCLRQEESCAREGESPAPVEALRTAAKAELLAAGPAGAVVLALAKEIRRKAFPEGRKSAEIDDQIAAVSKQKRPKELHLSREHLLLANPARKRA